MRTPEALEHPPSSVLHTWLSIAGRTSCRAVSFTRGYIRSHATALTRTFITGLFVGAVTSAYAAGLWTAAQASAYTKAPFTMALATAIMASDLSFLMLMMCFMCGAFLFLFWPLSDGRYIGTAFKIARDFLITTFIAAIILSTLGSPNHATTGKAGFPNQLSAPLKPVPLPQLR